MSPYFWFCLNFICSSVTQSYYQDTSTYYWHFWHFLRTENHSTSQFCCLYSICDILILCSIKSTSWVTDLSLQLFITLWRAKNIKHCGDKVIDACFRVSTFSTKIACHFFIQPSPRFLLFETRCVCFNVVEFNLWRWCNMFINTSIIHTKSTCTNWHIIFIIRFQPVQIIVINSWTVIKCSFNISAKFFIHWLASICSWIKGCGNLLNTSVRETRPNVLDSWIDICQQTLRHSAEIRMQLGAAFLGDMHFMRVEDEPKQKNSSTLSSLRININPSNCSKYIITLSVPTKLLFQLLFNKTNFISLLKVLPQKSVSERVSSYYRKSKTFIKSLLRFPLLQCEISQDSFASDLAVFILTLCTI